MNQKLISYILSVSILVLSSCGNQSGAMNTKELEALIYRNLAVGDSPEKIEAFLQEQQWPYDYDRFATRYSASYPEGSVHNLFTIKGVMILIYVDETKNFVRAEVEEVYTGM